MNHPSFPRYSLQIVIFSHVYVECIVRYSLLILMSPQLVTTYRRVSKQVNREVSLSRITCISIAEGMEEGNCRPPHLRGKDWSTLAAAVLNRICAIAFAIVFIGGTLISYILCFSLHRRCQNSWSRCPVLLCRSPSPRANLTFCCSCYTISLHFAANDVTKLSSSICVNGRVVHYTPIPFFIENLSVDGRPYSTPRPPSFGYVHVCHRWWMTHWYCHRQEETVLTKGANLTIRCRIMDTSRCLSSSTSGNYYLLNTHSVQHTETDNEHIKTHKTLKWA